MEHPPQNAQDSGSSRLAELRALGNPIDFITSDHLREREMCAVLDQIATGDIPKKGMLRFALAFVQEELPFHLADAEQDLFPLMLQRCEQEDQIEEAVQRLKSDHAHTRADTTLVTAVLQSCIEDPSSDPDQDTRDLLRTYTAHARRHLIVETAIILPIARARLTESDLDSLLLAMLRRRGLDRVMGVPDAE